MATLTARRKRKRLTACDSQVQSEVHMDPTTFYPFASTHFHIEITIFYEVYKRIANN